MLCHFVLQWQTAQNNRLNTFCLCHLFPERLHWPELETSKMCLLSPTEKPVSPSQVYLEHRPSGVLKDLFNTGTSSFNVLLQKEVEDEHKCPKRVLRLSTAPRRGRPQPSLAPLVTSGLAIGCKDTKHAQLVLSCFSTSSTSKINSRFTVRGSAIRLSPCPIPKHKNSCFAASFGAKLPYLSKGCTAGRDGENSSKKLCILAAIKPSNVEKERARFFKSNFTYNPQFEYCNPVPPQVLAKHSNASDRFLPQVSAIIKFLAFVFHSHFSQEIAKCDKSSQSFDCYLHCHH